MKFKLFLNEMAARSSLQRNLSKWSGNISHSVAIITAFQNGSVPLSVLVANRKLNKNMLVDVKQMGLSFYPVKGAGQEEKEKDDGSKFIMSSEEESFVVQPREEMTEEQFVNL